MVAVSDLVCGLDAELVRLGYKASTMAWYRGLLAPPAEVPRIPGDAGVFAGPRDGMGRSACGGFFDASTEAKRKALEAAYTDVVTTNLPEWNQSSELLNWLAGL